MLPSKKFYIFLCLLTFFFSRVVFAQVGNQASVEGTVTDPSGAVVPNDAIKLTNTGTGIAFTGTSNDSGYFRFPVIPVGTYELTAQGSGFAPYELPAIDVAVGAKMNLSISLAVAGQKQAIVVTGEAPVVETTRTRLSATVGERAVADLPVNGRNFIPSRSQTEAARPRSGDPLAT